MTPWPTVIDDAAMRREIAAARGAGGRGAAHPLPKHSDFVNRFCRAIN